MGLIHYIALFLFVALVIMVNKNKNETDSSTKTSSEVKEADDNIPIWVKMAVVSAFFGAVYYFTGMYGIVVLLLIPFTRFFLPTEST